jgi:hypothetical protein
MRLSDIEARFACGACGKKRGADVRPDFQLEQDNKGDAGDHCLGLTESKQRIDGGERTCNGAGDRQCHRHAKSFWHRHEVILKPTIIKLDA